MVNNSPLSTPPLSTLTPQLSTPNPQLSTLNPQLSTLNSPPSTLHPQLSTLHSQLSTLNSQLSTLHSQLPTLHSQLPHKIIPLSRTVATPVGHGKLQQMCSPFLYMTRVKLTHQLPVYGIGLAKQSILAVDSSPI